MKEILLVLLVMGLAVTVSSTTHYAVHIYEVAEHERRKELEQSQEASLEKDTPHLAEGY